MKVLLAFFMLAAITVASVLWGFAGFCVTAVLAAVLSFSISGREKEEAEQKRHEELMKAMQKKEN